MPRKSKVPLSDEDPTDDDAPEVDEAGRPIADETRELMELFSTMKGGPNIVIYFNSLPVEQRRTLLKIVKREMGLSVHRRSKSTKSATVAEARPSTVGKPLFIRIIECEADGRKFPPGLKIELFKRYFSPGSSPEKNVQWIEVVLRTPFGRYAERITEKDLQTSQAVLDSAIYGHQEAKHILVSYIAQLVRNQDSTGLILGLRSYPGVGKTNLADSGVSKILRRPFYSMSLGGVHDSSFLRGFQYTYEGSEVGYIARCITHGGIMNPVFFFDELDKVSQTPHGDEIVNTLIQLTDPLQSKVFQDRYLGSTATLDLSRCVFVFAYNDRSLLNPILRDRITEIELHGFSPEDKLIIARDYMVPRMIKDIGFPEDQTPVISERAVKTIIDRYTNEAGVRHLKRVLYEIYMELNLRAMIRDEDTGVVSTQIDEESIEELVRTHKPISIERTSKCKVLGRVNGLFVDTGGCSGILPLEATWVPSAKRASYEMRYTGNLGKVMGESTRVAWSVAWNLLDQQKQEEWIHRWHPEKRGHATESAIAGRMSGRSTFSGSTVEEGIPRSLPERITPAVFDTTSPPIEGHVGISRGCLHVHCRDNAMPKDGPSAGVALTVLMWSMLTDTSLPQEVAYTGEIGLHGTLMPIGGLSEKLVGAHRAGCLVVVIPQANVDHLPDKIPGAQDGSMQVVALTTIQEVIHLITTLIGQY